MFDEQLAIEQGGGVSPVIMILVNHFVMFLASYWIFLNLSRQRFSLLSVIGGGLVATVGLLWCPEGLRFLVIPLVLGYLTYRTQKKLALMDIAFFSFYAWGMADILWRILNLVLFPLMFNLPTERLSQSGLISVIGELLIVPIYALFRRFMGFDYVAIQGNPQLYQRVSVAVRWITLYFMAYGFLISNIGYLTMVLSKATVLNYTKLVILASFILFFDLVSYVNRWIRNVAFAAYEEEQARHLQSLRESSAHILRLYRELSQETVEQEGVNASRQPLTATPRETWEEESAAIARELPDLHNLNSELLQSTIEASFLEAKSQGTTFILEVTEPMVASRIDLVDVSIILSAFLRNALILARSSEDGMVRLSIFQDEGQEIVAVEATTHEEALAISNLEALHPYTEQGLGFTDIFDTVGRYPASAINITSQHHIFSQQLSS